MEEKTILSGKEVLAFLSEIGVGIKRII